MDEVRLNRIRAMMKDELSVLINRQLKDPRVPFVTVTEVKMTRDAKQATVLVSILNMNQTHADDQLIQDCLKALTDSKGYLKRQLGSIMQLRFLPDLIFKEDKGLENTLRVNEILKQLASEKKAVE
jgi:ribosome-binding factor A